MNLSRLNALLAIWLLCLFAPAALIALGVFGHFDINSNVGPEIWLWIGGYLVQFAAFMWISRIADKGVFLGWFAASLLPWAIDWTVPVSPVFAMLWFAVALAMAVYISVGARQSESLKEHGIKASGVVLQVYQPAMNVVINNVYIKRKLRLRVERADNLPAYEVTYDGLFMLGEIPSPGDRIALLVDPANPQHVEYDAAAGASSDAPAAPSAPRTGGIADQLRELADLHERGDLSDTEFAAAKEKLLGKA
jgi:hypothetical protein